MIETKSERRLDAARLDFLLPWYAAGTLADDEAAAVARRLARDDDFARRLDLVREERAETIDVLERIDAPTDRPFRLVLAAIEAEANANARAFGGIASGVREPVRAEIGRSRALACLCLIAALVASAPLRPGLDGSDGSGVFEGGSDVHAGPSAAGTGAMERPGPASRTGFQAGPGPSNDVGPEHTGSVASEKPSDDLDPPR